MRKFLKDGEYLFILEKMGADLNIKEKDEQEIIIKEHELRNKKYEMKLTFSGNALFNFGKLLANVHLVKHRRPIMMNNH